MAKAVQIGTTARDEAGEPIPVNRRVCPSCGHTTLGLVRMRLEEFNRAEFDTCSECGWSGPPREAK